MGDWGEFERWYRREHPRLVAALTLVGGNADMAKDAADEAMARAWERWDRVAAMASAGGWSYRVGINVLRRRQRRAAIERRVMGRHRVIGVPPAVEEVWEVVAALPARQRTAVVLRYGADLTENDVAEAMGVSRGTVAATLRDARRNLRRLLTDDCVGPGEVAHA
jgi:RNA polymerase sigma-70 factor, ECF subfamily